MPDGLDEQLDRMLAGAPEPDPPKKAPYDPARRRAYYLMRREHNIRVAVRCARRRDRGRLYAYIYAWRRKRREAARARTEGR